MSQVVKALEEVSKWLPSDRTTLQNIVHLCKENIEGVSFRDKFDRDIPKAWTLTPEYEAMVRSSLDSATARLQQLDPTYAPPVIEKKKAEGCFVITATTGDVNHPTVGLMRRFRDEWILTQGWGRSFVQWYYEYGPGAAAVIGKKPILRSASYCLIVVPMSWLARQLLRRS